jgi:hypothetical protein
MLALVALLAPAASLRPTTLPRLRGGATPADVPWRLRWRPLSSFTGPQPHDEPLASSTSSRRWIVYAEMLAIALLWVGAGTLFYSRHNGWTLATSFFYAVDAGMSIGFCTDVRELRVSSRAFTIAYIFAGAVVVGGALTLFVEDTMEGCLAASTRSYRQLLEQQAFARADADGDGRLTHAEVRRHP